MVKTIFFKNLFNNMLRHTSLIDCLAGHGSQVSQIVTAIFFPRPDAKAFGRDPHAWEALASGGRRHHQNPYLATAIRSFASTDASVSIPDST
jgi:hypothetical protein